MEKKKFKKLELKKQTIVDLSDTEATSIKGGTTAWCYRVATLIGGGVSAGVELSWFTCEDGGGEDPFYGEPKPIETNPYGDCNSYDFCVG